MPDGHCNISILAWPDGTTRAGGAAILVEALGMDPYTAAMRVAKPPPMIVARVASAIAPNIMNVLKAHRVPSFLLPDAEIARVPSPILAKRLEPAVGAPRPMYMVEPWRGEPVGLLMDDVYCIVRGRIGMATIGPAEVDVTPRHGYDPFSLGSGYGVEVNITHKRTSRISDAIDLWLFDREHSTMRPDGRVVFGIRRIRINCDKFNWDILGKSRGFSDGNNADQLAIILAGQAPKAALEVGFSEFRDASSSAIGSGWTSTFAGGSRKDDHGAFDFYSAWCGLMHWHRNAKNKP